MAKDFRAQQVQSNKLIASGSTGTGAKFLVYDIAAEDSLNPNQGAINPAAFGTSSIGTDIFAFISGGIGQKDSTDANSITAFGGDAHISGNLSVEGSFTQPDFANLSSSYVALSQSHTLVSSSVVNLENTQYWTSPTNESIFTTGSVSVSGSLLVNSGISGALNVIADGSPYLLAGDNITLVTRSNGAIEVSSSAGGGGATYWTSDDADEIYTTGSVEIRDGLTVTGSSGGIIFNTFATPKFAETGVVGNSEVVGLSASLSEVGAIGSKYYEGTARAIITTGSNFLWTKKVGYFIYRASQFFEPEMQFTFTIDDEFVTDDFDISVKVVTGSTDYVVFELSSSNSQSVDYGMYGDYDTITFD